MVRSFVLLVIATLVSATACEPSLSTRPSATLENEAPYRLKLLSQESCALPAHLDPKNVVLLSYRVELESHLSSRVPANYFYASLLTTDGDRYLSTYYGCAPLLSGDPLAAEQKREGYLNFSIPLSKIPEKLVYAPRLLSSTDNTAMVELDLTSKPRQSTSVTAEGDAE